ncbi:MULTISPECIES: acyl-CoA carboxylase subunit epsilon [unclassified Streptomyces]|uniref:acyl-CoA carboxylase subunit epsilon n=1 Tax=unclassified Streptomyces TaxID=2593676 RepID=UPI003321133F
MGKGAGDPRTVLRVERGQATSEELAAVTLTLLARLAGHRHPRRGTAPRAGWDAGRVYRAPHSWR